jgi:hypothetical protein
VIKPGIILMSSPLESNDWQLSSHHFFSTASRGYADGRRKSRYRLRFAPWFLPPPYARLVPSRKKTIDGPRYQFPIGLAPA